MIRLILLFILYLFIGSAVGQNPLFLEISGNYVLPGESQRPAYYYRLIPEIDRNSGFDLALGQQFHWNKLLVEPAIGLFYLQFRSTAQRTPQTGTFLYPQEPEPYYGGGRFSVDSFIRVSNSNDLLYFDNIYFSQGTSNFVYLSLPLKVKYPLWGERIYAGIGLKASFLMWSRQFLVNRSNWDYNMYNNSSNGLNTILFSGDISIAYNIRQNILFSLAYHQGFSDVFEVMNYSNLDHLYRPNRISMGIIYYILPLATGYPMDY